MKHGIMKYLKMVLVFVMVFSLVHIEGVRAEGEGTVCDVDLYSISKLELNENEYTITYDGGHVERKSSCAEYSLFQIGTALHSTEISISQGNYKITLNNQGLSSSMNLSAINIATGANVTLIVAGENSISNGNLTIDIKSGGTLSIQGDGKLWDKTGLSVIGDDGQSTINLNGASIDGNITNSTLTVNGGRVKGDITDSTINVTDGTVTGNIANSTLTVNGGEVFGRNLEKVDVTINKGYFYPDSITGKLIINGGATYITNGLSDSVSVQLTMTNGYLNLEKSIPHNYDIFFQGGIIIDKSTSPIKPVVKGTNIIIDTRVLLSSEWEPLEIPVSTTLVVDTDAQIGVNGIIKNYGTITNKGSISLSNGTGVIHNYGTIEGNQITGDGTFTNHTFIISTQPEGNTNLPYGTSHELKVVTENTAYADSLGKDVPETTYQWNLKEVGADKEIEIEGANQPTYQTPTNLEVGKYSYFCKVTKGEYSEVSNVVEVNVVKSGTKFDGGIQLDNTSYTYGDMFTVNVKPVSNGQVVSTFSMTAPTENQMAIFNGTTQVSEAVNANVDGIYEMSVDTTLLGAGTAKLTAQYIGNDNMADFSSDFTVTVNEKPLTIIADNKTIKVGETLPELTYSYTELELVAGHTLSVTLTSASSSDLAGTYPIVVSGGKVMNGNVEVTGNYAISYVDGTLTITDKEIFKVTVTASTGGSVTGGGTYVEGAEATVKATADNGYLFVNWTNGEEVVSTNNEYTFTVDSDIELVANFEEIDIPTDLNGIADEMLSSVVLPDGWTWDNPDTVLVEGEQAYPATYDNGTQSLKANLTVIVTKKEEETPVDPEPELPVKPTKPTKPTYKEETVVKDDISVSGKFNGKVEIKEPNKDSDGYKDTVGKVDEKDTIIDEIEIKVPSHKGDVEISVDVDSKYSDKEVIVIYGNGKETVETVGKVVDGNLTFSIGDMTGTITVLVVEKYRELDLSPYADGLLSVYPNSRVTSISLTEQGFKLSGYAFVKDMPMGKKDYSKLVREIIFVNEDNTSAEYAYRQAVKATPKGNFLTNNVLLNPSGAMDYTYATYDVEVKYNEIMDYKKNMSALVAGKYRIYIRVSDGKHAYLMPLKDLVLSDGSTLTLPSNMELIDEEERAIRLVLE